ncbi:MAG TPA: 50S ribosomal protein L29 [Bacteroidetes bacterium]|nr:50S ribosomal protein L29 [Bacteroidota bacterium]
MKQEVVKEMSTADMLDRLVEEKKHLTRLRLNHAVSPLENPQVIVESKKTIARMNTELRKRELEEKNNK